LKYSLVPRVSVTFKAMRLPSCFQTSIGGMRWPWACTAPQLFALDPPRGARSLYLIRAIGPATRYLTQHHS
jgi:hypothetical protein